MPNTIYPNFVLENKVEDQFNSHLDLQQFCKIDNTLAGTAGMKKKIHVYTATNGTEKLEMKVGNTQTIEASHTAKEYTILLAQNRGVWYDEEQMTDPLIPFTIARHAGTDLFNTMNKDIFAALGTASQTVKLTGTDYFGAFVDAQAMLKAEATDAGAPDTFALVSPTVLAKLRKALKDDLKYVESFARSGYVGTVAGTPIYVKKDAGDSAIVMATREACTLFIKKGTETELYLANNRSSEDANVRKNTLITRKYYLAALTNDTKAVKITLTDSI